MKHLLVSNERVITDGGYGDERCVTPKNAPSEHKQTHGVIRARHKNANRRIKQFLAASAIFRHSIHLHHHCFFAAANLAQLMILNGDPLFLIEF